LPFHQRQRDLVNCAPRSKLIHHTKSGIATCGPRASARYLTTGNIISCMIIITFTYTQKSPPPTDTIIFSKTKQRFIY
jgi:hypothetical protein